MMCSLSRCVQRGGNWAWLDPLALAFALPVRKGLGLLWRRESDFGLASCSRYGLGEGVRAREVVLRAALASERLEMLL